MRRGKREKTPIPGREGDGCINETLQNGTNALSRYGIEERCKI